MHAFGAAKTWKKEYSVTQCDLQSESHWGSSSANISHQSNVSIICVIYILSLWEWMLEYIYSTVYGLCYTLDIRKDDELEIRRGPVTFGCKVVFSWNL